MFVTLRQVVFLKINVARDSETPVGIKLRICLFVCVMNVGQMHFGQNLKELSL